MRGGVGSGGDGVASGGYAKGERGSSSGTSSRELDEGGAGQARSDLRARAGHELPKLAMKTIILILDHTDYLCWEGKRELFMATE